MDARRGSREALLVLGPAGTLAGFGSGGAARDASPEPSDAVLRGTDPRF